MEDREHEGLVTHPSQTAADDSDQTNPRKSWFRRSYDWYLELQRKYWHWGLACHYLFIAFNSLIVFSVLVTLQPDTSDTLSTILFLAFVSMLSFLIYCYGGVAVFFKGFTKSWVKTVYSKRRTRFWIWLAINSMFMMLWTAGAAVFYTPQSECIQDGSAASWYDPFLNLCSKVYTIWSFGMWNVLALFCNCFFIVSDELYKTARDERKAYHPSELPSTQP